MLKAVTIDDVAIHAGVSRSAVSRTFTPGASVSPAMRARVSEAAQILGYRPNLVARSLSKSQTNIIAVGVTRLENGFNAELLQAIAKQLASRGFRILLFGGDTFLDADPLVEDMLRYRPDGCLLLASRSSSRFADECRKIGVPLVLVNRSAKKTACAVVGDNLTGGRKIAEFLLAGGHQRFAFMAGMDGASTSEEREAGFTRRLREAGRRIAIRLSGHYDTENARNAARAILGHQTRPDALFCANDHMAVAAMDVARREFGMVIGQDISIVGYDDSSVSRIAGIDLTTYAQPLAQMAETAVDLLIERLGNRQTHVVRKVIRGKLIVRGSARLPEI